MVIKNGEVGFLSGNKTSKTDIMQFDTMIEQILSANHAAQQTAKQAQTEKSDAIAHIDEQKAELNAKYKERAERRINILEEKERSFADEKIDNIKQEFSKKQQLLEEKMQQNFENWANQLFVKVTGLK